ncbi:MAG: nucleotide exchange factor GrpE [Elusimicrobiaceae bacterium]
MNKKKHSKPQGEEEILEENEPKRQTQEEQTVAEDAKEASPEEETSKADKYFEQLVRLQADFENYRKRTEKEKPQLISYGKFETLRKLLPLYDTLLKAEAESSKPEANMQHIKQGLKMIFEQFDKLFKAEGVKIISAKGKPYDPMTQEVVTTIPCPPEQDGIVLEELAAGVEIEGKTVRPAQVIVGKSSEEAAK